MKFQNYSKSVTITPTEIYGYHTLTNPNFQAPKGYEFTGEFRPLEVGENGLSADGRIIVEGPFFDPRLILRRKPKRKVVSFTHTGEARQIKDGEWYRANSTMYAQWPSGPASLGKYEIVTYTESEE